MSVSEKIWSTLTTVTKMNDKVIFLADTVKDQQRKIENLTERLIRLETMLELAMQSNNQKRTNANLLETLTDGP